MTLQIEDVARQLPALVERYRVGLAAFEAGLIAAEAAMGTWAADLGKADAAIRAAMMQDPRPYALSFGEAPGLARPTPAFAPVTVVAADGSSIEPDRFAPVQCFVLNIGVAVLPYRLPGDPVLERTAVVGPQATFDDEGEDRGAERASGLGWGVNLQRDARELSRGADLAAERSGLGPTVLLVDGTLLPWDLDSRQVSEPVRRDAQRRTQDALDLLHTRGPAMSIGAYVSGSRSSDVVTSLAALDGRPHGGLWPPADAMLFARLLADGERSALFRAQSERVERVEKLFSPAHQICFFYLRAGSDIARVELPHWATCTAQVDRLQATIVDQCRRNQGYPRALQEAHEQAVISTGDRLQFSRLLDTEAARQGLYGAPGSKAMSKRRRAV